MENLMSKNQRLEILVGVLLLGGVLLTCTYNYLLFHVLAETFSIAIFVGVFIIAWNSRRFATDAFLYMLGIAFLFSGILDLVHTLAFKGMAIFVGYDANLPTQLWIAARYVQSIGFLIAVLHVKQKRPNAIWLPIYTGVVALALLSMFYWNIFPACYIEGVGLTPFKIASEYIISGILLVAVGLLWRARHQLNANIVRGLIVSALVTIASEMAFTLYIDVYGILNLVGHLLKIIAVAFVYKAVIEISLDKPYDSLFRELKKSEERFKSYFEQPLIGVGISSPDKHWIQVNDRLCSILGYSRQELGKMTWTGLTYADDLGETLSQFDRIVSGEIEGYSIDKRFVHKDGHLVWTSMAVQSVRKPNGTVDYFVMLIQDISDRKHAEEALRASAEKFNTLFYNLPLQGAIYRLVRNPQGQVVDWEFSDINPLGAASIGQTPNELVGKSAIQLFGAEVMTPYFEICREVLASGQPRQFETHFQANDRYYFTSVFQVGQDHYANISMDITERKRAEIQAQENHAKLEMLFDLLPVGISILDGERQIVKQNPSLQKILGLSQSSLTLGEYRKRQYIRPDGIPMPSHEFASERVFHGETAVHNVETGIVKEDGAVIWVNVSAIAAPFTDWNTIVVTLDITERKHAEQELARRNHELISLYQISDTMLKAQSIDDALHTIVADISAHTQFPIVAIETYDAKRQVMVFRESVGITLPPNSHTLEIPVTETLSGVVARTGKHLVETMATARSEYANQFLRQLGVQTFVCMPMIVGEQVIGVLSLAHTQTVTINDNMLKWAGSLANSIAASIERKQNEETIASLAKFPSENPNPILRLSRDGIIIYANSASRALLNDWDCQVGERAPLFWQQQIAEVLVQQANTTLEISCGKIDYSVTIAHLPKTSYVNFYVSDITLRKQAEAELYQLNRLYSILSQINQAIVHTKGRDNLFHEICRVAIEYGKYRMAWISLIDASTQTAQPVAWAGVENDSLQGLQITYLDEKMDNGPTGTAIRENRCVICRNVTTDPIPQTMREWAIQHQYYSSASVPIHLDGQVIGAFTVYAREPNTFDDKHKSLFDEIGGDISFALDKLQLDANHQQAENALRESQDRFKYVFDHSVIAKSITKLDGEISINQAYADMLGYSCDELMHRKWQELTHPDDIAANEQTIIPLLNGEQESARFIKRYIHKDGHIVWADVGVALRRDEQGKPLYFLTSIMDITDRKKAEDAVRASEEKYRKLAEELEERVQQRTAELQDLYDNSPAGYHSLNANGDLVAINQTELNWTGYARDELIGKPITCIFTPSSIEIFRDNFPRFKQSGRLVDLELEIVRKDGTTFPVIANATAIYDAHHDYVMSRSTLVDITDRKKAEDALRTSRDALDLANHELAHAAKLKDEFLANMSHELRTPLNAILGLAEGLLEQIAGPLNEKQLTLLRTIESSGQHLLALINDVLDLAKIEAGAIGLNLDSIDVDTLCKSSLIFVREIAQKKNIKLSFSSDPQVQWIYADTRRSKQMLVNLLSNAVKFTPDGGQVGLEIVGDKKAKLVRFTVWDTGIGIAQDHLPQLFKPFVQLDSGLTRRYEGTGLGLSLVARMAEMHGGSVQVTSQLGQGSRFTITLPWSEEMQTFTLAKKLVASGDDTQSESVLPLIPFGANAPCILIVEDNEANIVMLSMYLQTRGYSILVARNGNQAIELACAQHPQTILMDIQMPAMDGLEAIRLLRKNTDPQVATIPIIAVSALVMSGDREHALTAGANEYMTKPVNLKLLVQMIERIRKKQ
jgi:PAS domain S-box-containing protein